MEDADVVGAEVLFLLKEMRNIFGEDDTE